VPPRPLRHCYCSTCRLGLFFGFPLPLAVPGLARRDARCPRPSTTSRTPRGRGFLFLSCSTLGGTVPCVLVCLFACFLAFLCLSRSDRRAAYWVPTLGSLRLCSDARAGPAPVVLSRGLLVPVALLACSCRLARFPACSPVVPSSSAMHQLRASLVSHQCRPCSLARGPLGFACPLFSTCNPHLLSSLLDARSARLGLYAWERD